jgi:hypothetical protein
VSCGIAADPSLMPVLHVCPLCNYTREAAHTTVLDPSCPSCGAVLATGTPQPADSQATTVSRVARARWFERTLLALMVLPLLAASGKVGWSAAGVGGALGALLLCSLVCFVALAPSTRAG